MRLLCLDLATTTGVIRGEAGDVPQGWIERFRDPDEPHRVAARRLGPFLSTQCREYRPDLIIYEEPLSAQAARKIARHITTGTVEFLHGLAYSVESVAACYRIECVSVRSQTARKALGLNFKGKPGLEQKKMVRDICRHLGWWGEHWDLNVSDAAALFFWASGKFGGRVAAQLPGPLFDGY